MRSVGLGVALVVVAAHSAAADSKSALADARFERILKMLGPDERIEELCDYTAMSQIRRDSPTFRPDRAVASAAAESRVREHTMEVKGGAFRSRKKWYALSYTCQVTPDRMKVVSFKYTVGDEIPETKWAGYGLWD